MLKPRSLSYAALIATFAISGCGSPAAPSSIAALPANGTSSALPQSHGPSLKAFESGKTRGFRKGAVAVDITLGPDGAMWFTDPNTPAIGRISASGDVKEYTNGLNPGAKPYSIVAGGDGNLWFSDGGSGAMGRITPAGTISEFAITSLASGEEPAAVAAGSAKAVWAAVSGNPSFLVRTAFDGTQSVVKVPAVYTLDGSLGADASGNVWMMATSNQKGVMLQRTSHGGWIKHLTGLAPARLPCCPNLAPKRITIGADGNPWFSATYWLRPNSPGNVVGTTTAAHTQLFPVHEAALKLPAYPSGIAATSKKIWFVGDNPFQDNGGLWSLETDGTEKAFSIPYSPIEIAADASGNLWITAEAFGEPGDIVEATPQ